MLDLPDVTLVCVFTVCHDLTLLAVDECLKQVNFGDVKLFTNKDLGREHIKVEFSDSTKMAEFTNYCVPNYIKTSHILFVQYDSWVLDPKMWQNDFLKYDYVGAPWWYNDNFNVGNSGFNLRSISLMKFLAEYKSEFPIALPEDHTLCRKYQPMLPQFKWAPTKLAQQFAFERTRPAIDSKHFGFHGTFNWPFVLSYEQLNERMEIAKNTPYIQQNGMLAELDRIWYGTWGHNQGIYRGSA